MLPIQICSYKIHKPCVHFFPSNNSFCRFDTRIMIKNVLLLRLLLISFSSESFQADRRTEGLRPESLRVAVVGGGKNIKQLSLILFPLNYNLVLSTSLETDFKPSRYRRDQLRLFPLQNIPWGANHRVRGWGGGGQAGYRRAGRQAVRDRWIHHT